MTRGSGPADDETGRTLLRAYLADDGPLDERLESYVSAFPEPFVSYFLYGDAGLVALREMEPGVVEVKRLYVAPHVRRHGAGRALMAAAVEEARRLGYRTARLDTLASRLPSIALYESLGWRPIPPWDHSRDMVAYELDL